MIGSGYSRATLRRIQPLHITKHFIKKRLKTKKSKQNDQENA